MGARFVFGVLLIGTRVWGASRFGYILGGATKVGVSLSFVTDC